MICKSHKPIFNFQKNIKNISDVKTETFDHFMENINLFCLLWQQYISKKLEQGSIITECKRNISERQRLSRWAEDQQSVTNCV